jgi:hypothetical protein
MRVLSENLVAGEIVLDQENHTFSSLCDGIFWSFFQAASLPVFTFAAVLFS